MALKANVSLGLALIKGYYVKIGTTVGVGSRVRFGGSDDEIDVGGAGDDATFGTVTGLQAAPGLLNVAQSAPTSVTATVAKQVIVDVALDNNLVVPMTVGTGGSTRGFKQVAVANGVTDAPANTDGAVTHTCCGIAMQSGVQGDVIGVMPANFRFVAAS